ncbi:MAG: undecaprenyl-diphosphatase [Gemmataceae bacterium]|jgi:undecaprenyl-diphosphatase|nr:MAG: undecaprenyl-diphosphatase [Gemmataceae bacterium]
MQWWEAAILGLVQGVTEFLPISSTAHLLVVRHLLGHAHPEDAFTVVIQLGSMVAVVGYFRRDLVRLVAGSWEILRRGGRRLSPDGRWALLVGIGTIPAGVVGFFGYGWLKSHAFTLPVVAVVSVVFAVLMGAAEWWSTYRRRFGRAARTEQELNWWDALWMGCWQACALMPGGSRSGTTITGGLLFGLHRTAATRFSFVLALPIVLMAGLKEIWEEYQRWQWPSADSPAGGLPLAEQWTSWLVGLLVSTVVSYGAIWFLLRFVRRNSLWVFVVYRLGFGVLLLTIWAWGRFTP